MESWAISALLGIVVLLHWLWTYPHALSYQEQYQLFLLTGDYFVERISVAGGLADYLGEFLTQFYYIPWVGATILALLTVGVQRGVFHACQGNLVALILSLIPIAMLLRLQGDESVLLSYTVALVLTLLAANTMKGKWMWADVVLFPLLYWCLGPMAWLYAGLRVMHAEHSFRHSTFGIQNGAATIPIHQRDAGHRLLPKADGDSNDVVAHSSCHPLAEPHYQ